MYIYFYLHLCWPPLVCWSTNNNSPWKLIRPDLNLSIVSIPMEINDSLHMFKDSISRETSELTIVSKSWIAVCATSVCKAFIQNSHLPYHRTTPTGGQPFKCIECDKAFPLESDLATHIKKHIGEVFACHICRTRFMGSSNLRVQIKSTPLYSQQVLH